MTCVASNEWPPISKKSSFTPTCFNFSTSRHIPHTSSSSAALDPLSRTAVLPPLLPIHPAPISPPSIPHASDILALLRLPLHTIPLSPPSPPTARSLPPHTIADSSRASPAVHTGFPDP